MYWGFSCSCFLLARWNTMHNLQRVVKEIVDIRICIWMFFLWRQQLHKTFQEGLISSQQPSAHYLDDSTRYHNTLHPIFVSGWTSRLKTTLKRIRACRNAKDQKFLLLIKIYGSILMLRDWDLFWCEVPNRILCCPRSMKVLHTGGLHHDYKLHLFLR